MNKKIKMIGLDLDGTLLREDKTLSPYTKTILEKAIAKGIIVLAATGRPLGGIPKELREFPGMRYVISSNGARIIDQNDGRILYENLISVERSMRILDILEAYDTEREFFLEGQGYAEIEKMKCLDRYFGRFHNEAMIEYIRTTRVPVDNVRETLEKFGRPVDKVQGVFTSLKEKEQAWEELMHLSGVMVTGALVNNIEVCAKGVDKGLGLIRLGEILGIEKEEIMACGDGKNDMGMIKMCGLGVAMGNAMEEVKDVADYVTLSNEEDGAAQAIEKFALS